MKNPEMTELQLKEAEKLNTGTTRTNNEEMEENGYVVVKNLWDPEELYHSVPIERGRIDYLGSLTEPQTYNPEEGQVDGSLARYNHPQYKTIHTSVGKKLEEVLGRNLYNTYYYDRFYFPGQQLKKHTDRPACEISVSIHISTNLKEEWPIWIKTPAGEEHSVMLKPGDGVIYKGCERPHWRDAMPGSNQGKKLFGKNQGVYYHQIFMHYVLADGQRSHCAYDMAS